MPLDEDIDPGQSGHITDHETLADFYNSFGTGTPTDGDLWEYDSDTGTWLHSTKDTAHGSGYLPDAHHSQTHGDSDHEEVYADALSGVRTITGVAPGPTTYTPVVSDGVIVCDASAAGITINLPALTETVSPPAAGSTGKTYVFYRKDYSTNDVKLVPNGSDTLEGDKHLQGVRGRLILIADASVTSWFPITPSYSPTVVTKYADQSVTSSTTLVDDNELQIRVDGSVTYMFEAGIYFTASSAGDIKMTFSAPTGSVGGFSSSGVSQNVGFNQASTATNSLKDWTSEVCVFGGSGGANYASLVGVCVPSEDGSIKFSFAQNTSDGTPSTVKKGSWLRYVRQV